MVWHSLIYTLHRDEAEIRLHGNKRLLTGSQLGTVGDTYNMYMVGENAAFYKPSEARIKAAKGPTLCFEIYIDQVAVCVSVFCYT
jgi:hypothetical protein